MKKHILYLCAGMLIGSVVGCVAYAQEDRHPEMHAALHSLHDAEQALERASHNYGGHKEKAMDLIHAAQGEINAGIAFANRH